MQTILIVLAVALFVVFALSTMLLVIYLTELKDWEKNIKELEIKVGYYQRELERRNNENEI